jgi:hypothetical protein
MFRTKDHPQGATLSLLKSLLKTSYWLLSLYNPGSVAKDPYTTRHVATEPGLYSESNQ